ncbi:hypothetical protein ACFL48_01945 [Pseudomonadota bacterium]
MGNIRSLITLKAKAARTMLLIIITLLIPIVLTLSTVEVAGTLVIPTDNPTPLGYTWSLSLFLMPLSVLIFWAHRFGLQPFQIKAYYLTMAILAPVGIILDLLLGHTFFTFENHGAVSGYTLPAIGGGIPIEEFIFYISGFALVLLLYLWCDEQWLSSYNRSNRSYRERSLSIGRLMNRRGAWGFIKTVFNGSSLLIASFLCLIAIIYKTLFSESAGFPWYFIFLTACATTPALGLFTATRRFINWRAFSFTFFIIVLVSLIWEATLAAPYAWWGYHHGMMMGIYISAWHDLPIEAAFLWMAVTYTTVIVYEAIKLWLCFKEQSISQGHRTP